MSKTSGINLFTSYNTNSELETAGVPIHFGLNANKKMVSITIRRAGGSNTAFTKRYEALTKPYRRAIAVDAMDPDVMKDIMCQLYAETVVVSWEGVLDTDNETELEFSVENCVRLFKAAEPVFTEVVNTSMNASVYRDEVREADAKNS